MRKCTCLNKRNHSRRYKNMKIGFDNDKYLSMQSEHIKERIGQFGDKLYLEGKIRTRSYSDQSGAMRYITEIYVDNMEMLTPKGAGQGAGTSAQQGAATPSQQPQQMQQNQQPQQSQAQPVQDNPADDLPF